MKFIRILLATLFCLALATSIACSGLIDLENPQETATAQAVAVQKTVARFAQATPAPGVMIADPTPSRVQGCTVVHFFSSGGDPSLEQAGFVFAPACFRSGNNTILLESANRSQSDNWIIWDSLSLMDAKGSSIWQIGKNDAPPDYTDKAFAEFQPNPPFTPDYNVESMKLNQFPKELNDFSFPRVAIHFNLSAEAIKGDLILFLDTLYAKHDSRSGPINGFNMRITVNR